MIEVKVDSIQVSLMSEHRAWSSSRMSTLSGTCPGQRGTKKLVAQHGDRLICVRYRYDEQKRKQYKMVELIVEETDWETQLS